MAKETVDGLCQKAQEALGQGDYASARGAYQQALGLRSDDPDVHYGLATV
jgi:cytochrome c-type biogenesis protein CcmH/NrfG